MLLEMFNNESGPHPPGARLAADEDALIENDTFNCRQAEMDGTAYRYDPDYSVFLDS